MSRGASSPTRLSGIPSAQADLEHFKTGCTIVSARHVNRSSGSTILALLITIVTMAAHWKGQHFPPRPQFSGFMTPCRFEGEIQDLEVVGSIPPELKGVFYRVMPDPAVVPYIEDDQVRAVCKSKACTRQTRPRGSQKTVVQRRW